ncbi:MAG: PDZ domain-containing protein [Deltaproteobacteria bacterium]|nr:PDZ domain-containing protein [Deltaproteobacteria bacterium]
MLCLLTVSLFASGCINPQSKWRSGGLGIQLAQVEDGVVIKEIAPSFDNPEAKLLTGDYVVQVDGQNVANLPKEAILDIISGPVGSAVVVTVLRDGRMVTLEIERILLTNAKKRTLYSVERTQIAPEQPTNSNVLPSSAPTAAAQPTDEGTEVSMDTVADAPATDTDTGTPDTAEPDTDSNASPAPSVDETVTTKDAADSTVED